jgi:radical SAM superfamily enzyme YgiQ (UPF0313 family)
MPDKPKSCSPPDHTKRIPQRGKQVVLIHPPFCMPDKPYISTAVLYSHLSAQGVDVSVFDLNIEFYRDYLSLSAIHRGLDFIEKRFRELDNRPSLDSLEIQEYRNLVHLKKRMSGDPPPFDLLFTNSRLSNVEQFMLFGLGIDIVNTAHFPESLDFLATTGYIRHSCRGNTFSSHDVVRSMSEPSLYSSAIRRIMTGYLNDNTPGIIGISVSFPDQIRPAFYTASVIKTLRPEIHVCLGGTAVSSHLRDITNIRLFDPVDTFILDEGETPLLELIRCLNHSSPYHHIPGLMYAKDGRIHKNEPVPTDSDTGLILPDYNCADLDRYLVNTRSMALLCRLSRGCYWRKCSFCRTHLSFVNHHVLAELDDITPWIDTLVENTPVRILHFTDDAADPDLLYSLSRHLAGHDSPVHWVANMRFDPRITREKLDMYKKARCRALYFGLESCHARVLKKMKKGISLPFVEKTLKHCADIGIPVHLYMIVGFPTETEQEALESFTRVYEWKETGLAAQVIYNVFEISNGSDIASNPPEYGITEIVSPSSCDLSPPVSDFTGSGMEREKAKSLCSDFIKKLNRIDRCPPKDILALYEQDGSGTVRHDIKTRYDMDVILTSVEHLYTLHKSRDVRFAPIPGFTVAQNRKAP